MFDHIDFAVTDLPRSRTFYTAVLATLGIVPLIEIRRDDGREGTGFGTNGLARFWIGKGPPLSGRLHVAFEAPTPASVRAFHTAALVAGARSQGDPGGRPHYGSPYYAAFVTDPDGHVIEAVCRRAPD